MDTTAPRPGEVPVTHRPVPTRRVVTAWAVMVGGLVGFWCCRPWLGARAFNYGQLAVLLATWKVASLLCLPPGAWRRFTPLRFVAYCVWPGMQPRQFLAGARAPANAPVPTVRGFPINLATGAALLGVDPTVMSSAAISRQSEPLLTFRRLGDHAEAIGTPQFSGVVLATLYRKRLLFKVALA
jgi:hypothetical protein